MPGSILPPVDDMSQEATSRRQATRARRLQVYELRAQGYTLLTIARKIAIATGNPKYSEQHAQRDLKIISDALQDSFSEEIGVILERESARLDASTVEVNEAYSNGNIDLKTKTKLLLEISQQRAKILGLNFVDRKTVALSPGSIALKLDADDTSE